MRLRPSRIAREEGGRSARALRRISVELGRRQGSRRRARGPGFIRSPSVLQQRSLVKVSFAKNKGRGAWRAQGRYLSRAGAQREGEKGLGFDAEREDIALADQLGAWQRAGDRRLWKIVVSPEAGDRIDLQDHARRLMTQMEQDLGTRLEWAAIDHHDTDHPHVHIAVRGVDEAGEPLLISRDYVRSGIRARSQELLTRSLGHRHEQDRRLARARAVEAPRITEIDYALLGRARPDGSVSLDGSAPPHPASQERRLQELRRLRYLQGLGLAEQLGTKRWRLSPDLAAGLRQIQVAGDIQKSLARSRSLVTDRDAPLVVTRMDPGIEVTGRVAGAGLDESRDEPFLILEGTDGNRHLVPQTSEIVEARGNGRLRPGAVATLRGGSAAGSGGRPARTEIVEHGRLRELKKAEMASTALDLDALRSVRESGRPPAAPSSRRGFFRQWRTAMRARVPVLEREGLIRRTREDAAGRTYEVTEGAERMVEARMNDRGRTPEKIADLERRHGREIRVAEAQASHSHQGALVAYAVGDDGTRYAVLATGHRLTAIPTERRDLEVGRSVRARVEATRAQESGERRRLTWALDELEREHDRGRGR